MPKSRNKRKSASQNARIKQEKLDRKAVYFRRNRRLPSTDKSKDKYGD
jgi:hypothetical protein